MITILSRLVVLGCVLGGLATLSCADHSSQVETRSPQADYGKEPPRTADDQIVGADNVPPGDKLQQGPRAGSEGLQPAPGWAVDKNGVRRRGEVKGKSTVPAPQKPDPQ